MVSFFLSVFSLSCIIIGVYFLGLDQTIFLDWEILRLNRSVVCMTLIFDYISLIFMGCVLLISSMVIFYRDSYMFDDKYKFRFLILVFLFIISMIFIIISPNLIRILLGWDGLGLVSYCLVIYFQNVKSYNAGMLTIITNRIGDVAILISISWILNFGRWNFIFYFYFFEDFMFNIYILIIIAAFTKRAQIPFSSWLPAAMAAPTPVSALVHSSTLVTAGVYLLIRFYPIIRLYDRTFFVVIGIITIFISGLGANFEFDLKKIIALSTLSQLGLIIRILFIGFPGLAFFHLLSHAFFKALLFLCAGLIIHVMNNSQDIREMGFVIKILPYTSSCFIISRFSLAGIPFLSGFYSKDIILEFLFMGEYNFIYYIVFIVSVIFTIRYSFRLFNYLILMGSGNYCFQSYFEDKRIILSMILLTFFSIWFGVSLIWLIFKTPFFFISTFLVKIMPITCVCIGLILGIIFSLFQMNIYNIYINSILFFVGSMWYMPLFRTYLIYSFFLKISGLYYKLIDIGWGEFIFSKSHINYVYYNRKINYLLENNNVKLYIVSFLFLLMILLL